jgi:hypothetical protein
MTFVLPSGTFVLIKTFQWAVQIVCDISWNPASLTPTFPLLWRIMIHTEATLGIWSTRFVFHALIAIFAYVDTIANAPIGAKALMCPVVQIRDTIGESMAEMTITWV